MATIRWLHLTDLHVGMPEMSTSWPSAQAQFLRDLEKMHRLADGNFDLVLFSGDLTNRGTSTEFQRLDEMLESLWTQFRRLGSDPVLLAVPGNHDLVRPKDHLAPVRELLRWKDDSQFGHLFWDEKKGRPYRRVVEHAFEPYLDWLKRWRERHPSPAWISLNERGAIPGDFSASVRKSELSIGIVGLNSAFLHLTGNVRAGDLALAARQLHTLLEGRTNEWAAEHGVGLLMTHHPPEWLGPAFIEEYRADLFLPGWFDAHVCGHLHEPQYDEHSVGGAEPHRVFRGASIFGLQHWTTHEGAKNERVFGYAAARLERVGDRSRIRIWPRRAIRDPMGRYSFKPDHERFDLDDEAGNSVSWDLGVGRASRQPSIAPRSTGPTPFLNPPGGGYEPDWYFPPPDDPEPKVLVNLAHRGTPVLLTAAPLFGKTTVLQRLTAALREDDQKNRRRGLVVMLDLRTMSDAALDSPESCLRELAELLVEQLARALVVAEEPEEDTAGWVEAAWARPGTPERKLRALIEGRILSLPHTRIVLALDQFERLVGKESGKALARLLRTFGEEGRENERWAKIRLLIAATGSSLALMTKNDPVSQLFSTILSIHLEPFGLRELGNICARYGLSWSNDDLGELLRITGGWPFISRLILYRAALGVPKAELLSLPALKREHCALQLKQLWLQVCENAHLHALVGAMVQGTPLEAKDLQDLRHAGLIRYDADETRYVFSSALLQSYFEEALTGARR